MLEIDQCCLVVVDIQGKLAQLMADKETLFQNARILIQAARILEIPILWCQQVPQSLGPTVPEVAELLSGVEPIDNGCWDIVGNEVCYYYKDDYTKGRAHCWTFKKMGADRFSLTASGTGFKGIGGMDIGNPRDFSDRGRPWVCRGLLSKGPALPAATLTALAPGR